MSISCKLYLKSYCESHTKFIPWSRHVCGCYTCITLTISRGNRSRVSLGSFDEKFPRVPRLPRGRTPERSRFPGLGTVRKSSSGCQAAGSEAGASLRLLTHVVLNVEFRLVGVVAFSGLQLPESRPGASLDRLADFALIISYV